MKKELGIFSLLVALCVATSLKNPQFLSAANLANNANLVGIYGIFSLGLGLVIITGGIDLSVGAMFALTGVLLPMALREWHWSWPTALAAALAFPMFMGWVHGWLITRIKIQPFIVTLCGLMIYRGVARFVASDNTKGFGAADGFLPLKNFATGRLFQKLDPVTGQEIFTGIPMPFVILVGLSVIMWFVLHRSTYGRYLFAVGRNENSTRFSGINTQRVVASTYVIAGLLTGIAGLLLAFYTNSVSPSNHGNSYELYGIAAAVLGGCSLRGGEGSIVGILIGTALLRVLENLVNVLGIPSSLNFAVMGSVVLVGVLADQFFQARAAKKVVRH